MNWVLKNIFNNIHNNSLHKFIVLENYCSLLFLRKFCSKLKDEFDSYKEVNLHLPGENFKAKNYVLTPNTFQLLQEHVKQTHGQARTRFPPEPNGLLHIGHVKAININFGFARAKDGVCILRYDDTNPEMEEESYVLAIKEMIEWLGFKEFEVTYASDYFEQLYSWAEHLISKDLAYVCHQPKSVSNSVLSPWRSRPIEESLQEFRAMKHRQFKENEATLRLKFTTEQKTIDPVAYRIKFASHHRTKDEWCIYPTYDYAHCLCDSIQNITHSLCSSEFSLRRSTYYWICNSVGVYCPVQTEFGRLNFLYTVVSKRKIKALIEAGAVRGWDDPRLYTLAALQRRGFPPQAINKFCRQFGLRSDNAYVSPVHLHFHVREYLDKHAVRLMAVLNPLKVVITNFPHESSIDLEAPDYPSDSSSKHHTVTFDKEIWIEASDFELSTPKGYRRLSPTQGVGLKYTGCVIELANVVYTSSGQIDHLEARCIPVKEAKKPKAFVQWVASPQKVEVRLYKNLFKSERPDDLKSVPGGFLSDVNPDSLDVVEALVGRSSLSEFRPFERFQFERIGYFSVDPDTSDRKVVFNRILELKQDKGFDTR